MHLKITAAEFTPLNLRTKTILEQMDKEFPYLVRAVFDVDFSKISETVVPNFVRFSVAGEVEKHFPEIFQCEVYHPYNDSFLSAGDKRDYLTVNLQTNTPDITLIFGFVTEQAREKFLCEIFLILKMNLQEEENVNQ